MSAGEDYYEAEWPMGRCRNPGDYFRARPGDFPDLDAEEDDEEDDGHE